MAKLQCKILQGMAGNDYTYNKGSIQAIEEEEALRLSAAGVVEIIETKKKRTATGTAHKKATKRTK